MDTLTHANVLYNTGNLIYKPQVTNNHWKASTSSRNASSVSSVSNRAVFCLSGQQFIFFVFFIFTDWNISRCSTKRFSYLSLRFIRHSLLLLWSLLWKKALITSLSVSIKLSFQILFLHILGYSGIDLKNAHITRSVKCLCLSVRRPNLMALPCAVPQCLYF